MQKTHELLVTLDFEKPLSEADAKKWLLAAIARGNGKQPGPVVKQAEKEGVS